MGRLDSNIPEFRSDGYLPEGLYVATEAEVTFQFGTATPRRRRLVLRLRRWIALAHRLGAKRLLIDGSFVTSKPNPKDIDVVILLPPDFEEQIERGLQSALELEEMLLTHQPEEVLGAEDEVDWNEWIEFFSRTREPDERRKGLVEIHL